MANVAQAVREFHASSTSARPRVKSFDVFDTLISRRCIDPLRIFDLVEARSALSGFAAARVEAERAVLGRPYGLDAIYEGLSQRLGLGPAQTRALQGLEVAAEIDNVIPIAENIAAVADGDVLISDMYLGADTIRKLLEKAGFDKHSALVVSSDGKRSGRVWPEIRQIFDIEEHLGDDPHTDFASPRQCGVASRRTEIAKPNAIEAVLLEIGLRDLAELAREARLRHWSSNPDVRALQLAQASYNLPILAIASVRLLRLAQRLGAKSILFSSRDCNLWLPICRVIAESAGVSLDMRYFYTSRLARVKPSAEYLDYARAAIGDRTIVADLCGTGWSLAHLFAEIGRSEQPVAFLHQLSPRADYESVARTPDTARVYELLTDMQGCNNTAIEMCNYATHGMVVDVKQALGCLVPVFAPDPRSVRVKAAIVAQRAVAARFVESLSACRLNATLAAPDDALAAVGGALYKGLAHNQAVYVNYLAEHDEEDTRARRALGCVA